MKRKLFGGKLKDPIGFVVALSIVCIPAAFLGVIMTYTAAFSSSSMDEKIIASILGAIGFIIGIGLPFLFVRVVKNREKYPRLSKLLVKPGYFVDE